MSEPITPLTPTEEVQASHDGIIDRILIPLDQFVNAETGDPEDETISTRLAIDSVDGHGISKKIGNIGSAILNLFQKDHGAKATAGDLERAEAEEEITEKPNIINQ